MLFVALIPTLVIVGAAIAICIKTCRRHSDDQQTAQRRKVGNIPFLFKDGQIKTSRGRLDSHGKREIMAQYPH